MLEPVTRQNVTNRWSKHDNAFYLRTYEKVKQAFTEAYLVTDRFSFYCESDSGIPMELEVKTYEEMRRGDRYSNAIDAIAVERYCIDG